jgi:hypothetical protein
MKRILFVLLVPWAGCKQVKCGANTLEVNDICIGETGDGGPYGTCGPGTTYDKVTGTCRSNLFLDGGGLCGMNTVEVEDDAGNHICVGTGGTGDKCANPLPCPAPTDSQNLTLCGRVYDVQDTTPLDDGDSSNGTPSANIILQVYDPIAFVNNPSSAPMTTASTDDCGRFVLQDVGPTPIDGTIAIATDDVNNAAADDYVHTGVASIATPGEVINNMHAFVFRRTTDVAWSTAAGLPSTTTFGKTGVYIPIFIDPKMPPVAPFAGTPVSNVAITENTVAVTGAYYFTDTDPLMRTTVAPMTQTVTGPNGTGLYTLEKGLGQFSGTGMEPAGCTWPMDPASGPANVAYVQERVPMAPKDCP